MSQAACDALHADLVRTGVVAPAALAGPDQRAWLDCDLASLAENRLGDTHDPRHLDATRRADWVARATEEPPSSIAERSEHERCYWLLEDGERVGTVALATGAFGNRRLHLTSFYVLPSQRRRGVGRRAMARLGAAVAKHGFGLRLETSWCWQGTVRFYLSVGLWVYMWKRELTLCWDAQTPPPRIEVGDESASLSVPVGDSRLVLLRAHRRGDTLELEKSPPGLDKEKAIGQAYWLAHSTLALNLALRGWPLIQSPEEWEKSYWADGGAPESLAYKITIWEAYARSRGHLVETPRIPGLTYPTWADFEARWAADRAEFDLAPTRP